VSPERTVKVIEIQVGPLETNCYLLKDEASGQGVVIDPGDEGERLADRIRAEAIDLRHIILTHGHWDHVGGVTAVKAAFPEAAICIGAGDAGALTDPVGNLSGLLGADLRAPAAERILKEGDEVAFGQVTLKVLDTPGHTPGGITLVCGGEEPPAVFCGDLVFKGAVGRTDFPGGSTEALLRSIREKILPMSDDTVLYCGHEGSTTVGAERRHNPYIS
jgi:glyoxylase-like metal-dependent hydrolase (beta-lactamase superfamily II)